MVGCVGAGLAYAAPATDPQPAASAPDPVRAMMMGNSRLEQRVTQAAEATLAEQGYVSAVDVLPHLGLWGARSRAWVADQR